MENHHPDYRECASCQVLVAVEQIDPVQLNELYRSATFTSADESRFAAQTYSRVLKREIKNASNILDIGSSDGAFLAQCRKLGVKALLGIEPSAAAAAAATENTWVGPFAQYPGEGKWDLITLFMTIEHLQDPEDFLQWAKKRLAPGGLLAVAHHDYRASANLVLGARSPILDIEHLRIYSKTSMEKLLKIHGFEVTRQVTYVNMYPLGYFGRLMSERIPALGRPVEIASQRANISLPAPFGNVMTVARPIS